LHSVKTGADRENPHASISGGLNIEGTVADYPDVVIVCGLPEALQASPNSDCRHFSSMLMVRPETAKWESMPESVKFELHSGTFDEIPCGKAIGDSQGVECVEKRMHSRVDPNGSEVPGDFQFTPEALDIGPFRFCHLQF